MPLFKRINTAIFRDMSSEEKKTKDEQDILPVAGYKGWTDFCYIVFFFFFAGLACSGALLYFMQTMDDANKLSYAVRDKCGGYPSKWTVVNDRLTITADAMANQRPGTHLGDFENHGDDNNNENHDDDNNNNHDDGEDRRRLENHDDDNNDNENHDDDNNHDGGEDRRRLEGGEECGEGSDSHCGLRDPLLKFYVDCYVELALETVSIQVQKVIELYLLSVLLFVCLVVETKEYIHPRGYVWFNTMTMVYYITESLIFFWFMGTYVNVMGIDDGTMIWENTSMLSQLVMVGPINHFIALIMVCRLIVGLVTIGLLYKFKTKDRKSVV